MLVIDFETSSELDLTIVDSVKYAKHPSTRVFCMAYKEDNKPTRIWTPGYQLPEVLFDSSHKIYAHNALFDYLIWREVAQKLYQFPITDLTRWVDTQALAQRYTFPGKLAEVGKILNLDTQKNPEGKRLIKKFSQPLHTIVYTAKERNDYLRYCMTDVDATYELIQALPASTLTDKEQHYWYLTQLWNLRGVPVQTEAVEAIVNYIEAYADELTPLVPEITQGAVQKVTQIQKLQAYIDSQGVKLPNMQAETVEKVLKTDIPGDVRKLLELRQILAKSSTAKFTRLKDLDYQGRVYNNFRYYGTGTGRWSGMGFQLHNLPRASVDNPDEMIRRFVTFRPIQSPLEVAKALIRPVIKASKGRLFMGADYVGIENHVLPWMAGDDQTVQALKDGIDQYKDMAAYLFNTSYDDVAKDERYVGKIIILGCGYQMGFKKFMAVAESWGVKLSMSEAKAAVQAYRKKYFKITNMWDDLFNAALNAIRSPGYVYEAARCKCRVAKDRNGTKWLVVTLPSGRNLFYYEPRISQSSFGFAIKHMGMNQTTHQWTTLVLTPGRLTENVVQATARDILANGCENVEREMREVKIITTIHDEALSEIKKQDIVVGTTLQTFTAHLCDLPEWAGDLSVRAEGWIGKRFRK